MPSIKNNLEPEKNASSHPRPKIDMTLGTVQLGLYYGATNKTGKPSEAQAIEIIHHALENGVTHLDCAQAYGDAEKIIGKALEKLSDADITVITKLSPLSQLNSESEKNTVTQATRDSIQQSLTDLKRDSLDVLMLHRWEHYKAYDGLIWQELQRYKQQGKITHLGVSVQSPQEAIEALAEPEITYIQLPFNILDQRWKEAGVPNILLNQRQDVMVHVRSTLLQGILTGDVFSWPKHSEIQPEEWIQKLNQLKIELKRTSLVDLCFAYVRSQPWINSVVVGVETLEQLQENQALFQESVLSEAEALNAESKLTGATETLLNPALWSRSS